MIFYSEKGPCQHYRRPNNTFSVTNDSARTRGWHQPYLCVSSRFLTGDCRDCSNSHPSIRLTDALTMVVSLHGHAQQKSSSELPEPARRSVTYFNRHLIGRTTNTACCALQPAGLILFKRFDGTAEPDLAFALASTTYRSAAINNPLCGGLLTVQHEVVHKLRS